MEMLLENFYEHSFNICGGALKKVRMHYNTWVKIRFNAFYHSSTVLCDYMYAFYTCSKASFLQNVVRIIHNFLTNS